MTEETIKFNEDVIKDGERLSHNYKIFLDFEVSKLWNAFLEEEKIVTPGSISDSEDYGKLTDEQRESFVDIVYKNWGSIYDTLHQNSGIAGLEDDVYQEYVEGILGFNKSGLTDLLDDKDASSATLALFNNVAFEPLAGQIQKDSLKMLESFENRDKLADIVVNQAESKGYKLAKGAAEVKAAITKDAATALMTYKAIMGVGFSEKDAPKILQQIKMAKYFDLSKSQAGYE
jgi:hypothetical protein